MCPKENVLVVQCVKPRAVLPLGWGEVLCLQRPRASGSGLLWGSGSEVAATRPSWGLSEVLHSPMTRVAKLLVGKPGGEHLLGKSLSVPRVAPSGHQFEGFLCRQMQQALGWPFQWKWGTCGQHLRAPLCRARRGPPGTRDHRTPH